MKKINWLDHIANLLVVILGISIAFYLEGYREEKANRIQEQKYIKSLTQDLATDSAALDTLQILNRVIGNSLVRLSDGSVGKPIDADSLVTWLLSTQYNPSFTPQRTTYESLKSSGKMDLIGDFELRKRIVELYEQYYRGTSQYDEAINQDLRDFYKPFYMKNIAFTGRNSVNEGFLTKTEFRNAVFAYRYLFIAKTDFYETVSVELEETLSLLRKRATNQKD
ncbi:MAG: DUF6090 family protein [Cyclobacteriaceae bacterium]